ncbi:amino acid adenylation domain-containing protein [Kitasatospora sp. NPDC008050]|uniref:non-ribosomal peptide synthetase n=1 Tax=Kitasatospora sp. NPDC008050 TaxID=3364021 RepID=UPI0036E2B1F1
MPSTRPEHPGDPSGRPDQAGLRERLAALWCDLLGLPAIGPSDDFFALGGHSLLATRLATRIRTELGLPVTVEQVFTHPTTTELARALGAEQPAGEQVAGEPAIRHLPRTGRDLPLSFPQERIWLLQQLVPHNTAYNFQCALTLRGPLDVPALEAAYTEVVRRHEILRTSFHEVAGRPVQRVHPPFAVLLPVQPVPGDTEDERRAAVPELIRQALDGGFDTSRLPLVRWRLLRVSATEHVLIQVEHHFVHDGWSLGVLLGELVALYRAAVASRPAELPQLEYQFGELAAHTRAVIAGDRLERELDYWQQKLAGLPPLLELPLDRPRPPRQSFDGGVHKELLAPGLYEELKALGRDCGATLFMLLSAAFSTLLHRVSGSTDVLTATGVANRRLPQSEPLLGMFVNTLPLRTDLGGDPSFRELVARVRAATLELYAHQDAPFEKVVAVVRPDRDLSYNPLYQVMFSFHDAAVPDLELAAAEPDGAEATAPGGGPAAQDGALRAELELLHNGTAKADLNVIVVPRPEQRAGLGVQRPGSGLVGAPDDGVLIWWEYSSDLFDPETVAALAGHYQALLRAVVADPDRPISRLDLLDEAQTAAVRAAGSGPLRPWPQGDPVPAAIAARAAEQPGAPALVAVDGTLWSRERLDAAAGRVAARLRTLGVRPEDRVPLVLPRGPEGIATQLGVLRAGALYLPLDPEQPAERIAALAADCGPARAVTTAALRGSLGPVRAGDWLTVEELLAPLDEEPGAPEPARPADPLPADPLPADPLPGQAAYAIYTSGSTGRPKAVTVTHAGLANLAGWHRERFQLTDADRVAHLAGLGFDASVWEVYPALAAGATVVAVPEAVRRDAEALRDWLVEQRITVSFAPTPLAERLLALPWPAGTVLRHLLAGGDRLRRRPPAGLPFTLVNAYGPTEHTVVASSATVDPDGAGLPSIGTAVDNTRLLVLDTTGRPVPPGLPGELYLAGPGVARGYLGDPARTAAAFRPEAGGPPGSRTYRTGDRVRLRRNGELDFLGRVDQQVQLRGVRIEPGEIEHALLRHPEVAAAVVVLRGEGESAALAGYVVPRDPALPPDPAGLRGFLTGHLPLHLVPTAWAVLAALPLTPSGKPDLAALPEPTSGQRAAEPLGSAAERRVAEAWSAVLGRPVEDRNADFFALGGHSLAGYQVMAALAPGAPLRLLFEHPTVAELAGALADGAAGAVGPDGLDDAAGAVGEDGEDPTAGLSDAEIDALLAAWDGAPTEATEEIQ